VRWIFVVLIGSEVYSIVTYLLSENSDDGNSDCCASAVVTKICTVWIYFADNGITRFWSCSTSLNVFKVKGLQMTLPQTLPLAISMFKLMRV